MYVSRACGETIMVYVRNFGRLLVNLRTLLLAHLSLCGNYSVKV